MSGVVKVQSACPTWLGLTALHFHFATQCIPTPLAWFAHHMPSLLLQLGVLVTMAVELPLTLLILSPLRVHRVAAAALNVLLQVMIIATGNYNFFNFLTIALTVPLLDDAPRPRAPKRSLDVVLYAAAALDWLDRGRLRRGLWWACTVAGCVAMTAALVTLSGRADGASLLHAPRYSSSPSYSSSRFAAPLRLSITPAQLNGLLEQWLPPLLLTVLAGLLCAAWRDVRMSARAPGPRVARAGTLLWTLLRLAACALALNASLIMFTSLDRKLGSHFPQASVQVRMCGIGCCAGVAAAERLRQLYQASEPWRIASAYGLFRRMTGVGEPAEPRCAHGVCHSSCVANSQGV